MKSLYFLPLILTCLYSNVFCEVCKIKDVNVYAYKDRKSVKRWDSESPTKLLNLTVRPTIAIIAGQKLPVVCKRLTKRLKHSEMVFLTNNNVVKIEHEVFNGMKKLKALDLSNNLIREIRSGIFNGLKDLFYLDLSRNKISFIDSAAFDNMRNLKEFNISDNRLTAISNRWFTSCPHLHKLDFRKNKIAQLPYLSFLNLNSELEISIDLSVNKISKVANGAFENILKFNRLELQRNNLTDIPPFETLKSGLRLNLKGNPITCFKNATLRTLARFEKVRMRSTEVEDNCVLNNEDVRTTYHIVYSN